MTALSALYSTNGLANCRKGPWTFKCMYSMLDTGNNTTEVVYWAVLTALTFADEQDALKVKGEGWSGEQNHQ